MSTFLWPGFKVAPHFDAPYTATSIAEFWSRRWNLCAGNALRWVVQEPVLEGRLVRAARSPPAARVTPERRLAAAAAAFAASGVMHEVQIMCAAAKRREGRAVCAAHRPIYNKRACCSSASTPPPPPPLMRRSYLTGHWAGGLMLAFFCAQVPLMLAERWLGQALRCAQDTGAPSRCLRRWAVGISGTRWCSHPGRLPAPPALQAPRLDAAQAVPDAGHAEHPAAAVALHLLAGRRAVRRHAGGNQFGAAPGGPGADRTLVTAFPLVRDTLQPL